MLCWEVFLSFSLLELWRSVGQFSENVLIHGLLDVGLDYLHPCTPWARDHVEIFDIRINLWTLARLLVWDEATKAFFQLHSMLCFSLSAAPTAGNNDIESFPSQQSPSMTEWQFEFFITLVGRCLWQEIFYGINHVSVGKWQAHLRRPAWEAMKSKWFLFRFSRGR